MSLNPSPTFILSVTLSLVVSTTVKSSKTGPRHIEFVLRSQERRIQLGTNAAFSVYSLSISYFVFLLSLSQMNMVTEEEVITNSRNPMSSLSITVLWCCVFLHSLSLKSPRSKRLYFMSYLRLHVMFSS